MAAAPIITSAAEAAGEVAVEQAVTLTLVETGAEVAAGVAVGATVGPILILAVAVIGLAVLMSSDEPVPKEADTTEPCPDECEKLLQDIRDAINRNKRDFGNKGIHGLRQRLQELITGPCGPGQLPYRVNSRGQYLPTPVWENHIKAFNETKSALQNRFNKALDAGCDIPDDLLQDAIDAESLEAPTPDQWKGDPARPCADSPAPPDWYGPPEPPGSRGV